MTSKVKMVSAYVDLRRDPDKHEQYMKAGKMLLTLPVEKYVAEMYPLEHTWMWQFIHAIDLNVPLPLKAADNGNRTKDSIDYMCVQHEKIEWMRDAARNDPSADVFVWVDYGILNLKGVREEHILDFIKTAETENFISIPGCWNKGDIADNRICWRFCGGALAIHRRYLDMFGQAVRNAARTYMLKEHIVEWEVNTWARVERDNHLPIKWYLANHDQTMFTNYTASKLSGL